MADIGATLREARMRQHLDISDIEARTKIRAKYLRALENEEWDLLPGDTFVRSFLRTYAETLGLDARTVLEEYKLRFTRPSEHEVMPISSRDRGRNGKGRQRRGSIGRDVLVAVFIVALVGVLILLGRGGGDGSDADKVPAATTSTQERRSDTAARTTTTQRKASPPKPKTVSLRLAPKSQGSAVWVCVRDADRGLTRFTGNAGPDTKLSTYHSKRFRVTLGNGSMNLRIDGKFFDVPESDTPIGYEITPGGKAKRLAAADQPQCGA